MANKRVIIACGNGVATSTVVAAKVKDYCAVNGVSIDVTQCRMIELHDKANDYDLVVTSGKFSDLIIIFIYGICSIFSNRHTLQITASDRRNCIVLNQIGQIKLQIILEI